MATDWTDACARAAALRNAYYQLISGQSESLIRHSTTEGDQEIRYARADLEKLKAECEAAEAECAALTGAVAPARARRYAIRAGSYNPFRRWGC